MQWCDNNLFHVFDIYQRKRDDLISQLINKASERINQYYQRRKGLFATQFLFSNSSFLSNKKLIKINKEKEEV